MAGRKHGHVVLIMKYTLYDILATGTSWEDPYNPDEIPTIATNATVSHYQQANETYGKACRIFETAASIDESLKHQIFETIEYTWISELRNKYTCFMGVNTIDLVHYLMDRYGNIIETDVKENQKRFYEALETIIPIDKYFEKLMTESSMYMVTNIHKQRPRSSTMRTTRY